MAVIGCAEKWTDVEQAMDTQRRNSGGRRRRREKQELSLTETRRDPHTGRERRETGKRWTDRKERERQNRKEKRNEERKKREGEKGDRGIEYNYKNLEGT